MLKIKTIYLVIEFGSGIIHKAFDNESEAKKYIGYLQRETDLDCYEIQPIPYQL